jgi:hypothetical protein
LVVLARHTGQSVDYFLGAAPMTANERQEVNLVQIFRALPPQLQQERLSDAQAYSSLRLEKPPKS